MKKFGCFIILLVLFQLGCTSNKEPSSPPTNTETQKKSQEPSNRPSTTEISQKDPQSQAALQDSKNIKIATQAFQTFLDITQKEESDAPSEKAFKSSLISKFRSICYGDLLKDYEDFVNEGSLESCYFPSFYDEWLSVRIKSVKLTEVTETYIKGEIEATNNKEIGFLEYGPDINTFVHDYKVEGMTQEELDALTATEGVDYIDVDALENYTITLFNDKGTWKFTQIKWEPIKTVLKTLIIGDKKVDLRN